MKTKLLEIKYWIHWALIAVVVLGILQLWKGGQMLTILNVVYSTPLIAIGDIVSGYILKLLKMNVD